jgi:hypothetical protein
LLEVFHQQIGEFLIGRGFFRALAKLVGQPLLPKRSQHRLPFPQQHIPLHIDRCGRISTVIHDGTMRRVGVCDKRRLRYKMAADVNKRAAKRNPAATRTSVESVNTI